MSTEASTSTAVVPAIVPPNLSPTEVLVCATTDIKAAITTLRGTKDAEVWKQVHRHIWDALVSLYHYCLSQPLNSVVDVCPQGHF